MSKTGQTGRYEALIRMADEPGEPITPDTFLPIAERSGLMPAIDRWVIHRVISALASGELPSDATIAVNISARSFTDAELLDYVNGLLEEHDIAPEQLIFAVTESAAIANMDQAERFGRRLTQLGCGFAPDDFGTGFGSFIHIKHLPYSHIKIDGDFIRGMVNNKIDRILVEALVHVAHGLGKKTVAEFVGDEQTMSELRELGVDYAQGYHIGKPAPIAELLHTSSTHLELPPRVINARRRAHAA
jgi:EAL domain-containing protein (putative c-di-GMP-specific phosphodiesterase class I)